jgi:hypothetical protein
MENAATESFEKALAELIDNYKFMINECPEEPARPSDNSIRATARWYGVNACDLYEAFNAAIAAA